MSRFEFISVMLSIVLALGITEVLVCWARLIQHRREVRFSWIHGFWTVFIVILMIQFWWGFWNFREVENWTFLGLSGVVFETMMVVIAALLLTPGRTFETGLNLEALYFANSRPFFLVGVLMVITLTVVDTTILGLAPLAAENLVRVAALVLVSTMAFVRNRRLHYVATAVFVALLLAFMFTAEFR